MILAQISEQKRINDFYSEIFDARGAEIYLKPMKHFIKTGKETTFYTVMKAAYDVGCIAIGYKIMEQEFDKEHNFGVMINPPKDVPTLFSENDFVIVFSNE
jgi:hypothetical protein